MLAYIIIAIGVSILTGLFLYLDSRLFDRPKKKLTYIKVMLMNIVIVLSTIYILTWLSPTNSVKNVVQMGGQSKIEGSVVDIKEIGEQMLGGEAPF